MYDDLKYIYIVKAFSKDLNKKISFRVNSPKYSKEEVASIISKIHNEYDNITVSNVELDTECDKQK
tara:strand:+ start:48521 stop:48718 length:198 start_codon:yes stop_codon:yes gene_type:complete